MEKQQTPSQDVYIRDKIQNIFVTYIIPLNILHIFSKYSEHILVQQDHDRVKAAVEKGGDSLGATELLHRLYRYKGWYQCLLSVLRDPGGNMSHVAQMMEEALAPRKKLKLYNFSCQKRKYNLLLIGKTGSGKSATGNSILKDKKFKTSSLTTSGTQDVQVEKGDIGDYKVTIVDCPGVGDSSLDKLKDTEKLCENMEKAMNLCGGGFHALLLVLKYGNKYTHDEQKAVRKFKAIFGENIVKDFCIIIMTHGEVFDMEVADLDSPINFRDWLLQQTGAFQDLLQECMGRCILFQNKKPNTEYKENQTKHLLSLVQDMMCQDIRYTHEHFALAERQRIKLLVESKKPYLRKKISERTSKLSDEFYHLQETNLSRKIQALRRLKKEAEVLLSEIDVEDRGTRTLDNLRKNVINFHKLVETQIKNEENALKLLQGDGTDKIEVDGNNDDDEEDFKSDEDEEDGYDQTDDGADDESEDDNESVDGEKNGGSISEDHAVLTLSTKSVSIEGFDSVQCCSAWNPVYDLLAVGCDDATAIIWNMGEHTNGSGDLLTLDHKDRRSTTTSLDNEVRSLDWASDGTYLATVCFDGITRIWSKDGCLVNTFGQNERYIFSVKWSRGGTYVCNTDFMETTIYDAKDGRNVQSVQHDKGQWIVCFVDWQNDNTFASCVEYTYIHIYCTGAQEPVKIFKGHTDLITCIKWDPQGQLLASCSRDKTVKIWDMKNDQPICDLLGHSDHVFEIEWSPTGPGTDNPNQNLVLASASRDRTVRLWDVEYGKCLHLLTKKHTERIKSVAFSPDGRYIASGESDGFVCIWNVQTGSLTHSYRTNEPKGRPSILDMYWTHRGDKLVVPTRNGYVDVCDLKMVMPHRQLDS